MLSLIQFRLPRLLESQPIGLVVIDSVAAAFGLHSQYINRARNMRTLVSTLRRLGITHNFAVVCINQVRSNMRSMEAAPALGLAWANLVTTRLQIYKEQSVVKGGEIIQKRRFRVTWASNVPTGETRFYISSEGISSD